MLYDNSFGFTVMYLSPIIRINSWGRVLIRIIGGVFIFSIVLDRCRCNAYRRGLRDRFVATAQELRLRAHRKCLSGFWSSLL